MYNNKYNSYADVLESYMIAEEGIFSKIKNKMEEKRKEREERIRLFEEEYKKALPLINKCIKDTLRDAKRKYKNVDLNDDYDVYDDDSSINLYLFSDFNQESHQDEEYQNTDKCIAYITKELRFKIDNILKNYKVLKYKIRTSEADYGNITIEFN